MILTDDTRPSHLTFANQVGVQTDDNACNTTSVPDELRRTIDSHCWLTNLEVSSGIPTMCTSSTMPRSPHPDGPTRLTMSQLDDAQSWRRKGEVKWNLREIEVPTVEQSVREDALEIHDISELGLGWACFVSDLRAFLPAWQDMELASP